MANRAHNDIDSPSGMKIFLLKVTLLALITALPYLYLQYQRLAKTDSFYWKASQPAQSLILGGSRALKGISPDILQQELGKENILNFAFTALHSPYGKPYYSLIKKKLKDTKKGGVFILSVTPGSIMDYADIAVPREEAFRFYRLFSMKGNPHWEYLIRNPRLHISVAESWVKDKGSARNKNIIHSDGWEETPSTDRKTNQGPLPKKINQPLRISVEREYYLEKTIQYLQERGTVFLVRLPISERMKGAEQKRMRSDFTAIIQAIADANSVTYFDYSDKGNAYQFVNGHHHLSASGARKFTLELAIQIKENL